MMKFPNGKTYIGQSVDIYNRIKQHNWASKQEGNSQTKLFNALNKYGLENVELIVLWQTPREIEKDIVVKRKMDKLETDYIKEFNCIENGYNVQSGGQYIYNEVVVSKDNRKQRSERMKEYWGNKSKPSIEERFNLIYEYGVERAAELCGMSEDNLLDSINYKDYSKAMSAHSKAQNTSIDKSVENPEVMKLVEKHYEYLRNRLVHSDDDADCFGDCILNMTYRYNPEEDFIIQFVRHFKGVKGTRTLDKKLVDINIKNIDDYDSLSSDEYFNF